MSKNNVETVIKLIEEVWNNGNFQVVEELIAPEYTIRHDPGDQWEGQNIDLETFKKRIRMSRSILPDQKFYIEDTIQEKDKVVVSWRFIGTQKGDIPGLLEATNKTVNITGITIYYFSHGKIIGHWQVLDKLSLLSQLGVQIGKSYLP